jgi:hypothetical protein
VNPKSGGISGEFDVKNMDLLALTNCGHDQFFDAFISKAQLPCHSLSEFHLINCLNSTKLTNEQMASLLAERTIKKLSLAIHKNSGLLPEKHLSGFWQLLCHLFLFVVQQELESLSVTLRQPGNDENDKHTKQQMKELVQNGNVKKVELSWGTCFKELREGLKNSKSLTEFILEGRLFEYQKSMGKTFKAVSNCRLTHFELRDMQVNAVSLGDLISAIENLKESLTVFKLVAVTLQYNKQRLLARILGKSLQINPDYPKLSWGKLFAALGACKSLKVLVLESIKLVDDDMTSLCQMLPNLVELEELNIKDHCTSVRAMQQLADCLNERRGNNNPEAGMTNGRSCQRIGKPLKKLFVGCSSLTYRAVLSQLKRCCLYVNTSQEGE